MFLLRVLGFIDLVPERECSNFAPAAGRRADISGFFQKK
jgi:hypothetical protein